MLISPYPDLDARIAQVLDAVGHTVLQPVLNRRRTDEDEVALCVGGAGHNVKPGPVIERTVQKKNTVGWV